MIKRRRGTIYTSERFSQGLVAKGNVPYMGAAGQRKRLDLQTHRISEHPLPLASTKFAVSKFLMWIIQFAVALSGITIGHIFHKGSCGSSGAEPVLYFRHGQPLRVRFASPTLTLPECGMRTWVLSLAAVLKSGSSEVPSILVPV